MKLEHLFENEISEITDPYNAYYYAKKQGKRIPELEPIIMKNPTWAYYYVRDVIKGRWPEAEPIIMKDPYHVNAYLRDFPEVRNPSKDVPLVLGGCVLMDIPNTATDEQVEKLIKMIEPRIADVLNVDHIKKWRLYYEPLIIKRLLEYKKMTTKQILNDEKIRTQFFDFLCVMCEQLPPKEQTDFE